MKAFHDISFEYRIINKIAYPKITIKGLVKLPVFAPGEYFTLNKYIIPKSEPMKVEFMNLITFRQSIPPSKYMDYDLYMALDTFISDWNIARIDTDITAFLQNAIPNIIDMETDLVNNMYVYRIVGLHQDISYRSSYVAGIRDITTKIVNTVEFAGLSNIIDHSINNGNIFSSDSPYVNTEDPEDNKIYIKGSPFLSSTPRHRGPIDHTIESAYRKSVIDNIEYIKSKYNTINTQINAIMDKSKSLMTDFTQPYRGI